jgi:hypothetical protein
VGSAGAVQQGSDHGDGGVFPAGEPAQGVPFVVAEVDTLQRCEQRGKPVGAPTVPPLVKGLILPLLASDVASVIGRANPQWCEGDWSMNSLIHHTNSVPSNR